MFFLVSSTLASSNGRPSGRISASSARPTVVSTIEAFFCLLPSSSVTVSVMRTLTFACRPAALLSNARFTSATLANRSEEHTSELQSLMRISYAVFCLKKKNYKQKEEDNEDIETSNTTT